MSLKKRIIFYCLIIFIAAAYFGLAYFSIFYRIGAAGLKAPDRRDGYLSSTDKTGGKNLTYAALGDSLTSGVGASRYEETLSYLLAGKFAGEKKNIIYLKNFSYPGAKTADLINDLLSPAIAAQPDMVTLLIGINDVYGNYSLSSFEKKYRYILERLAKETKAKIYPIGLPYIGSPELLLPPYNFYFYGRIGQYNEVIRDLSAEYNLEFIDLAALALVEFKNNRPLYSADLFHPSPEGYKIWANIIYDAISK